MSRSWLFTICAALALTAVGVGGLFAVRQGREARASELLRRSLAAEGSVRAEGVSEARIRMGDRWRASEAKQIRDGLRSVTVYSEAPKGVRIVDDGQKVARVDDENKRVLVVGPPRQPPRADAILRNYRPVLEDETTEADRKARWLALRSRHRHHLAKRLAVDHRTSFPLHTQTYNADGELVSENAYKSIQFDAPIDPKAFEIPKDYELVDRRPQRQEVSPSEPVPKLGEGKVQALKPTYVPEGYELEGYYVGTRHHVTRFVEIRYSDGLRDLSLYEHLPGTRPPMGPGDGRGPRPSPRPEGPPGAEPRPDAAPEGGPRGWRGAHGRDDAEGSAQGPPGGPPRGGREEGAARGPRGEAAEGPRGAGRGPWRRDRDEESAKAPRPPQGRPGRGPQGEGPPPDRQRRRGFGPPTKEPVLIERGRTKVVRMLRGEVVVIIVGDLTQEEMLKVAESIPDK